VICLTRDHGQRKNERKENGKKDRLPGHPPNQANVSLYTTLTLARPAELGGRKSEHARALFSLGKLRWSFLGSSKGVNVSLVYCYTRLTGLGG